MPEKHDTYRWIDDEERLESGRSMSVYDDPGLGELVREGKDETGRFDEELVEEAVEFINTTWGPSPQPEWVTAIPSTSTEGIIIDIANRIAERLGLKFVPVVEQVEDTKPQKELANSYQQCWNVKDAFDVNGNVREKPVLLIDDIVGSRWTLTEVGRILRKAGSGPVLPFTLAERKQF